MKLHKQLYYNYIIYSRKSIIINYFETIQTFLRVCFLGLLLVIIEYFFKNLCLFVGIIIRS